MKGIRLKIALFESGDPLPLSPAGKAALRRRKLISRILTIIATLFVLTFLVQASFGDRGFFNVLKIRSRRFTLREEVKQLEEKNALLVKEIQKLRHDDYYKEKLAREKLGFIREGEIVFLFPENQNGKNVAPPDAGKESSPKQDAKR